MGFYSSYLLPPLMHLAMRGELLFVEHGRSPDDYVEGPRAFTYMYQGRATP